LECPDVIIGVSDHDYFAEIALAAGDANAGRLTACSIASLHRE
jgi:hypothetical protein